MNVNKPEEKIVMKSSKQYYSLFLYGLSGLILIADTLVSGILFKNLNIDIYPSLIKNAYQGKHHLNVPGSSILKLSRTGAYGIYYQYNLADASVDIQKIIPPAIDCSLTSKSNQNKIKAVPDFVESNRYWSKDRDQTGVLIMSITVEKPDTYTFACHYQDGRLEPEIIVTLGPNYIWEFLRVAWKLGSLLMGGITIICGSFVLSFCIAFFTFIGRSRYTGPQEE